MLHLRILLFSFKLSLCVSLLLTTLCVCMHRESIVMWIICGGQRTTYNSFFSFLGLNSDALTWGKHLSLWNYNISSLALNNVTGQASSEAPLSSILSKAVLGLDRF